MIRKITLALAFIFVLACSNTESHDTVPITPVPSYLFQAIQIPSFPPTPVPTVETTPVPTVKATPRPTPKPKPLVKPKPTQKPRVTKGWHRDPEISWYGPGFYGKRTACGLAYTKTILGVAHRSLPCGTLVSFRYKGQVVTVPVIDRGPYVAGRTFDMSGGLCVKLKHCFTGPIEYKIGRP